MQLTAIRRYPVKSWRGEDLDTAPVEPWGLAGDRRWMVVDAGSGGAITAREAPSMLLADPAVTEAGLRLEAPGQSALDVTTPGAGRRTTVSLWSSVVPADDAGDEAAAWVSALAGRAARLVHLGDPTVRTSDPAYSEPGDRVSLADGYPLLVTTTASLGALNDALAERTEGLEGPLSMHRFRPNVVVDGDAPWAEDDWRRLRIGEVTFRAVKGCARCVMTTRDPETAEGGKEPLATLARVRRFDKQTWFGVNLVPDLATYDARDPAAGPLLRLGDGVEVLDAVEPGGGPLR